MTDSYRYFRKYKIQFLSNSILRSLVKRTELRATSHELLSILEADRPNIDEEINISFKVMF